MRRLETLIPVAEGASGRVYRARDADTGEVVAIKQLRRVDARQLERLRREAVAQQRLDHPHICRVRSLEQDEDGTWQLVLDYVDGSTLEQEFDRLALDDAVRLLADVCDAVAAAHAAGIVHRDLKPANILLRRDEDAWFPLVTDFGLARGEDDPVLTATGEVLGTPAYMAPEQARGEQNKIGPRTDVFALGCLLYEALTGAPPFEAQTVSASLDRLLHEDAPHPRTRNPHAPEALCRVALQCLEDRPERRYASARELTADLWRWLADERVAARPVSLFYRFQRRLRRHPVIAASAAMAISVLVTLVAWNWISAQRAAAREAASIELATQLAEIRSDLALARLAPAHDLAVDRDRLRQTVSGIAAGSADGRIADLVEASLAEAWLALGDYEKADRHAQRALAATLDDRTRALRAETLLRRYEETLVPILDLSSERRDERLAAARETYLAPAIGLLGEVQDGARIPRETLARLAILEGDFDEARIRIADVEATGPGDYRSVLLQGELVMAEAERALAIGEEEAALQGFEAARRLFHSAADTGRSDPVPRAAACRAARGTIRARMAFGGEYPADLATLEPGCVSVVVVDSADPGSHVAQAAALAVLAQAFDGVNNREQARLLTHEGLFAAQRASALAPDDRTVLEYSARLHQLLAGLEPEPADVGQGHFEAAVAAVSRLQAVAPDDPESHLLRGTIERDRARHQALYGRDPTESFAAATTALDDALKLEPGSRAILTAAALNAVFRFYDRRSENPPAALRWARRAIELQDQALALDPGNVDALFDQGANHGDLWYYLLLTPELAPDLDRSAFKSRALELLAQVRELAPRRPLGYTQAMMIHLSEADFLAERGLDAREAVSAAGALEQAAESAGTRLERDLRAWVALARVNAELAAGADPTSSFARAWETLAATDADASDHFYVRLHQLELAGTEARWRREAELAGRLEVVVRGMAAFEALVASERRQAGVLCGGGRLFLEQAALEPEKAGALRTRAAELFLECLAVDDDFGVRYEADLALLELLEVAL